MMHGPINIRFILDTSKEKKYENRTKSGAELVTLQKKPQTRPFTFQTVARPAFCSKKIKVFVFLQHVARTVKEHYKQSNNLHSSLCCANCVNVFGGLKRQILNHQNVKQVTLFVFASGQVKQHVW